MTSKVSRRLTEPVAQELLDLIYAPRLGRDFKAIFGYMTELNQAHTLMLHRCGLISPEVAASLAAGLDRMKAEGPDAIQLDPSREDAYFNYEAHLTGIVGADTGGRLHIARSRNDLTATLDRLRARDLLIEISSALIVLQAETQSQASKFRNHLMPGYTHLQPAQPITFGFYLAGFAQSIERDLQRFGQVWERTNLSALGAGALAGTTFPIDREWIAQLLALDGLVENTLDAVASRDFALEILSNISQTAVTWSRIAQDFHVWVSHEFQLIDFPDRVTGTSSIMPQKKNPVVIEYLKGKSGHLLGLYVASTVAVKGSAFTNTMDGNREAMRGLWEAGEECLRCLQLLTLLIASVRPNEERMRERAADGFTTATDLADALVREAGVSFREAHHIVGAVVREAMDTGQGSEGVTAAMVERAGEMQLGRRLGVSEAFVRRNLDPQASVSARTLSGFPGPEAVASTIQRLSYRLNEHGNRVQHRRERLNQARASLEDGLRSLRA